MTDKRPKLPRGRPQTHGGYSILTLKGILPEHRREVRAYLTWSREQFIKNYGPKETDLTASQLLLINQTTTLIGTCRCMEEWCKENGVMRGADLAPTLQHSYLAYCNTIRLNIMALNALSEDRAGINQNQYKPLGIRFKYGPVQDQEDDRRHLIIEVVKTKPDPLKEDVVFNMPRPGQIGEEKSAIEAGQTGAEAVRGKAEVKGDRDQYKSENEKIVHPRASWRDIPKQGQGEMADPAQDRPGIEIQSPPARRMDVLGRDDHVVRDGRAARNKVRQLQLEIEILGRRKRELLAKRRKDDGVDSTRLIGEKKR